MTRTKKPRADGKRAESLWRYLVPNLITAASMLLGLSSIFESIDGDYVFAGWLILFAVVLDKADGVVARLLRGTSELGLQLDSFADLLNFGIAPPVMIYASLSREAGLAFSGGAGRVVLVLGCSIWMLGAVFRLARFNVSTANVSKEICFGVPTTLAAGTLAVTFLALLKYTSPGQVMTVHAFGGAKLFPFFSTPVSVWRYLPLGLFAGGFLMGSNLRMVNFGGLRSRWFSIFALVNFVCGVVFILSRLYPEFLMWQPISWTVVFLIWGQASQQFRSQISPPIFPRISVIAPDSHEEPARYCDGGLENFADSEHESLDQRSQTH